MKRLLSRTPIQTEFVVFPVSHLVGAVRGLLLSDSFRTMIRHAATRAIGKADYA